GVAPGLRTLRARGFGWRLRHRDVEPLKIEIELYQRLACYVDGSPAIERGIAKPSGDAVDHHDHAVEPHLGLGRQRRLQDTGRTPRGRRPGNFLFPTLSGRPRRP